MRTLTIAVALVAASISTASASCGGEWSFYGDITEQDKDRETWSTGLTTTYDDRNDYRVGFEFSIPFGDDDCEYTRAKSSKERAQAQKERDLARKAEAEARYAANRAAKEEEFAISKRIDNLQRIIVTCETHSNLPICDKIDEMSMELYN